MGSTFTDPNAVIARDHTPQWTKKAKNGVKSENIGKWTKPSGILGRWKGWWSLKTCLWCCHSMMPDSGITPWLVKCLHVDRFAVLLTVSHSFNRDLTKPRRRRQRERQKTKGLMSKTTTLHVHHAFLYISLPSLHSYDMQCPNFKFTWERERQGDKSYHLCPNLSVLPSLQLQPKPLLLHNRAN